TAHWTSKAWATAGGHPQVTDRLDVTWPFTGSSVGTPTCKFRRTSTNAWTLPNNGRTCQVLTPTQVLGDSFHHFNPLQGRCCATAATNTETGRQPALRPGQRLRHGDGQPSGAGRVRREAPLPPVAQAGELSPGPWPPGALTVRRRYGRPPPAGPGL